jgi:hypothetical protein
MNKILCAFVTLLIAALTSTATQSGSGLSGPDATLTIKIDGKLGPVLAGKDPVGANGKAGSITIKASESLKPTSHTSNSATYKLPADAVVAVIDGRTYKNTKPATMKISIPAAGPDTLYLTGTFSLKGTPVTITGTASMDKGAFPSSVLKHPTAFKSPQKLTPAKTATGPGSKVSYAAEVIGKTVLGLTGTATD